MKKDIITKIRELLIANYSDVMKNNVCCYTIYLIFYKQRTTIYDFNERAI